MEDCIVRWAAELQSMAQTGLYYCGDDFDRERYLRIREIAAEMAAERTGLPVEKVTGLFCGDVGYQTPKVDTRAAIFQDGKILLVQEKNGAWALPGGWCEYNLSPAENAVKEVKEEAGLDAAVRMLIAVQDRQKHNKPDYAYGVVKIFYLCEALGGSFVPNSETVGSGYFGEDGLPPLAAEKCTEEQIGMCFQASRAALWTARFD